MFDVNVNLPDWPEKFMLEVYSDTASPAAKEFGESLKRLTGAIKCVTVPFAMMGYTAEYLEERFIIFLEESLKSVKRENLQKPNPMIAAQIIRDVVYAFDQKELYKLYKHLLASAADKTKSSLVHPSFVSRIAQLDSVDISVLNELSNKNFVPYVEILMNGRSSSNDPSLPIVEPFALISGYENEFGIVVRSIHNLQHLGLINKIPNFIIGNQDKDFNRILANPVYDNYREEVSSTFDSFETGNFILNVVRGNLTATYYGKNFSAACTTDPASLQQTQDEP